MTSHLLKTYRDSAVDLQASTDINIGCHFHRERRQGHAQAGCNQTNR